MSFETIVRQKIDAGTSQFHKAIDIWCCNPQVTNRRLLASVEILNIEISHDIFEILRHIDNLDLSLLNTEHCEDGADEKVLLDKLDISSKTLLASCDDKVRLFVTKQLPRTPHIFSSGLEFSLLDQREDRVINIHKPLRADQRPLGPRNAYMISHEEDGHVSISVCRLENDAYDSSIEWLEKKLFPCILKWMSSEAKPRSTPLSSLSLVSREKYAKLYCELKEKYSTELIKNWPENTDPKKFVYEDIAIATYLLLLWEKERSERGSGDLQSFLDLGCGNGLLVHILFSEGHRGLGIDLRRRKIWDLYPPNTPLQVRIDSFERNIVIL